MKWFILGMILVQASWAKTEYSKIVPAFIEASRLYIGSNQTSEESLYLRPDIRAALGILESRQVDPALIEKYISFDKTQWKLRKDDLYDRWVKSPSKLNVEVPELSVHAVKIDVIEESDDWTKDDIYAYFFVTDGVIPTGKVTSIYKGISSGQGFFFNEVDRNIFPLIGIPAKKPDSHLIVDYGIIESDGDDVKELQKLSSIIIDIAIAVYASYDPQHAEILINLRKEIKAMAELLLSLNSDDRLVTSSFGYKNTELAELLETNSYVELTRKHKYDSRFDSWEYHIQFRLLRN